MRLLQVVVPLGRSVEYHGAEVYVAPTKCPSPSARPLDAVLRCKAVAPATLDAIYAELKKQHFDTMRVVPSGYRSPHYGRRVLQVAWGNHFCEVTDGTTSGPGPADIEGFRAIMGLIMEAAP